VAEIVSLAEAIASAVHDGDTVAMEGFPPLRQHRDCRPAAASF
jgi:acyl CoA:acetate/3-ketoacid CoA transferase alpha subunit